MEKFGAEDDEVDRVPRGLAKMVRQHLTKHPPVRWDQAVAAIAGAQKPEIAFDPKDDDDEPGNG